MNKRIQDLASQCGLYIAYDNREVTGKELEHFAELIVRECIAIIETQQVPIGNSVAHDMAADWTMDALRACRSEIKEYFGV
jgi:hypothetical protein